MVKLLTKSTTAASMEDIFEVNIKEISLVTAEAETRGAFETVENFVNESSMSFFDEDGLSKNKIERVVKRFLVASNVRNIILIGISSYIRN